MFSPKLQKCCWGWLLLCFSLSTHSQERIVAVTHTDQIAQSCELIFYWQAGFTGPEKQKIQDWLCLNYRQVNDLIGPFSAKVEVYLYRRDGAVEPVPWASTDRGGDQQIRLQQLHFYVDPRFPMAQFLADWTAVHEFSHLALPLLDRADQWFAEGFASYMQVKIQHQQGFVADPRSYYQQKLQPQLHLLDQDQPMIPLLQQLMQQRRFKAGYWGSVLWFVEAETLLKRRGGDWGSLIRQYQQQRRFKDRDLAAVIASFDMLSSHPNDRQPFSAEPQVVAKIPVQPGIAIPSESLQQLLQRYQQQPASRILQQHPLLAIKENSN